MPKPRKKRSLTISEDKQDTTVDCSQRLDQDSDVLKTELSTLTEFPVSKRAKMGKVKEKQYDKYCWVCHFEDCSEKCSFCPRVYHASCVPRMETTGDWTCPECQTVLMAEKNRTTSPVMSLLSSDQLCNLLKYSLNRMEMHVPKDFCFGSSSSVFYPMDFPLLEKNIRKKVYTSPAAFLADAKWIFHNHSVYFPLAVPAIKTIIKVCQEEMREIETCPDCYLHAYSMKEKWFSEPCRKPHTLVWAKLKGFPIWPAKAVKTANGNVDVRFFGGHERAWVPVTHCYFLSRDPPQAISSQKKNFEYAHQEVELHIKLLSQRFGGFEYAPHKTPFNPSQIYLHLNVTLSKLSYLPQSLRDKRKQEVTTLPVKRRLSRAHSAHEIQGNRKDEEKKESNMEQSLIEKDHTDKMNDSQKDKSVSLVSLTEAVKSCEEKCADSSLVIDLQENKNATKELIPLLSESIHKKENNNNSEAKKKTDDKGHNLTSSESDNSEVKSDSNNNLQNDTRTEVLDNTESNTLEETDADKNSDQENAKTLEALSLCIENQVNTADYNCEHSSIQSHQSVANCEDDNEPDEDIKNEILDNSKIASATQDFNKVLENLPIESDIHNIDNLSSIISTQEFEVDVTKVSTKIYNCIDKGNNNETDLNIASKLIVGMPSVTENENKDHNDNDAKNEKQETNINYTDDEDNTREVNKSNGEQGEIQMNSISSKQNNEMPSQITDVKPSQNKNLDGTYSFSTSGTPLQNMKEIVIVVKNLKEDNKISTNENNIMDSTAESSASSVTLEVLKKVVSLNDNSIDNDGDTEVIDGTNVGDKNVLNKEEDNIKMMNITDSVKSVIPKVRITAVHKKDKHPDDVLKFPEKNEEFHVDDSHLEKSPLSSNSLRIRIVKGKVESESPNSLANKESENTPNRNISKTSKTLQEEMPKSLQEETKIKDDVMQSNNENQVKSVTQKPDQLSESLSKQGVAAASSVIRKSKRPRKNFVIQFPHNDTHSTQDIRDSSSAVVLQQDCETNNETSNHSDEPDIIKNFKATIEKIHKVKSAKGSVMEKVIDCKSYKTHSNEAQRVKTVKPLTSLTNSPVVIKLPTSNLSEHIGSSKDYIPPSTATNHSSQNPSSKISGSKSLQIIAIDNRSNCTNTSTIKPYPDLSQSCIALHKQTEVSHCSSLGSECINNNKGETPIPKSLNIRDQTGTAEVKSQDMCSNVNMLLQNVQVSLKENSTSNNKETSPANLRNQTDVQTLHLPTCDKEKNLFNILPVEKYARKLTVFLTNTLEEMCQDIINSGCMKVAMHSLETEVESLREKHKKDLADVKQNADLVLKEMRVTMETEKQNAVAEVRRQCEMEMRKNVEEAKKKQWCANCGKEAVFYCCWNTSYCDYPCQQTHWPQHMSLCGQNHVPPVKEQQIVRMPNLGPDMTITQSSPGLPLEIQLTTHSPTQTNKNKKKPQSSSEKIPVTSRSKGRSLTQSPNASIQPHDITRSSHMIYSPHYRLQGGQVIPVMLSHSTPHQQQCGPNVVMENKSHNVQHTVPFSYNSHVCM